MQIRVPDNLGMILLAVWLIASGALPLLGLGTAAIAMGMSILAIVAGILLLMRA